MTRTRLALLTIGDPGRVTGGYLFHRRLAERAPQNGAVISFVSIPDLPLAWALLDGPRWLLAPAMRTADVVVLDSIAAAPASPWLGRIAVPVVGMLHQPPGGMDSHHLARSFRAPFDRWAYRTADVLMVASDWLGDQLAAGGVPRDRLRVVPPGKNLDEELPGAPGVQVTEVAKLRMGRRIAALCVANWLPRKGILELLEAVAGLPGEIVTLHLVGDTATRGRYAARVRQRLRSRDLRDRVVVHGLVEPAVVRRMYRTADVFLLPSFEEPYGTVGARRWRLAFPSSGGGPGTFPSSPTTAWEGLLVPAGDVPAPGPCRSSRSPRTGS